MYDGQVVEQGRGKGRRLLASPDAAWHYLLSIDFQAQGASYAVFIRKVQEDPVRPMLDCPGGIMAIFSKGALMDRGMDDAEASRHLVAGAVERTRGQDEYAREEAVAKVQRAVAGARSCEAEG